MAVRAAPLPSTQIKLQKINVKLKCLVRKLSLIELVSAFIKQDLASIAIIKKKTWLFYFKPKEREHNKTSLSYT